MAIFNWLFGKKIRSSITIKTKEDIGKQEDQGNVKGLIMNPPTGKSPGFLLRKAPADETLELEKAGELKRSTIEENDMEVYLLIPPEGERFKSTDSLALKGSLVCPICKREMPVIIKEINFSGFLNAYSCFHTSCSNCHSTTEFRGITTGEDSEDTSKFWFIVFPSTGPPGMRPSSRMSQPRIRMDSIERRKK